MKHLTTTAVALILFSSAAAYAQTTETPRIDARELKQEQRIDQGVDSGALTEKEADHLDKREDNIKAAEDKAKADGVVTKKERAKITHKQNKANRHIAHQKHDRQRAHNG